VKLVRSQAGEFEELEIPVTAPIALLFAADAVDEVVIIFSDGPSIYWNRPSSPPTVSGSATAPLIEG